MLEVTLEIANRLFEEARNYSSGRTPYIAMDSEIREIALAVFGVAHVQHLSQVCYEIFYLIACDAKGVIR